MLYPVLGAAAVAPLPAAAVDVPAVVPMTPPIAAPISGDAIAVAEEAELLPALFFPAAA